MKRGFYGIGIFHPKSECNQGTLWRSAWAFGADFIFTVGARFKKQASDTPKAHLHVPMYHYLDLADLMQHLPYNCPLVGVELADRARGLKEFCHPERACYLLGAEDHGLPPAVMDSCHLLIQIEGAAQCLNVATSGSIVLYDRVSKHAKTATADH